MNLRILKAALSFAVPVLLALTSKAQPELKLDFASKRTGPGAFDLHVSGRIPESWYLYGVNKNIEGLSAPNFAFEYENVQIVSTPEFAGTAQEIKDAVFDNKKAAVYRGTFELNASLKIKGTIPATLRGKLTVYLANQKEFYPLELPFNIGLEGGV